MGDEQRWNERYRDHDTPWENGQPHPELGRLFEAYAKAGQKILEIGCGVGTNAQWLTRAGYRVIGIDFAPLAIGKARQAAFEQQLDIDYFTVDFMQASHHFEDFPVVFDCAVFHLLSDKNQRQEFVTRLAQSCQVGGYWISIIASKDELAAIAQESGVAPPPALSLQEVVEVVEASFEVIEIQRCPFAIERSGQGQACFHAWAAVFKKR